MEVDGGPPRQNPAQTGAERKHGPNCPHCIALTVNRAEREASVKKTEREAEGDERGPELKDGQSQRRAAVDAQRQQATSKAQAQRAQVREAREQGAERRAEEKRSQRRTQVDKTTARIAEKARGSRVHAQEQREAVLEQKERDREAHDRKAQAERRATAPKNPNRGNVVDRRG